MARLRHRTLAETRDSRRKTWDTGLETLRAEPIIEQEILRSNRGMEWNKMNANELIAHARKLLGETAISNRSELQKAAPGLYKAISRRKMLEEVGLNARQSWSPLSDAKLIDFARGLLKDKGIKGRRELAYSFSGLYNALRKRGLLENVGFEKKRVRWFYMTDEELVEFTRIFIQKNSIGSSSALEKLNQSLYDALRRRNIIDKIIFVRKLRHWRKMSNDEAVRFALDLMKKERISGKYELEKTDSSLYKILRERNLLKRLKFEKTSRRYRDWASMSNEQLIEYARGFMNKNEIQTRKQLEEADQGLYLVLLRRRLIDTVGFKRECLIKQEFSESLYQAAEAMEKFGEEG